MHLEKNVTKNTLLSRASAHSMVDVQGPDRKPLLAVAAAQVPFPATKQPLTKC